MNDVFVLILPLGVALAGMRIGLWIFGATFNEQFRFGFRFALGLAIGMLVFSQAVLLSALAGFNASFVLAWFAIFWGMTEFAILLVKLPEGARSMRIAWPHLWLLLLLPLLFWCWVYGRLATLEGTLEYDANVFWVFKAKILFLEQGGNLIHVLRDKSLAYAHLDYPMLVPCLYTLDYGAVGSVDEFVNKVWPFWMMVALYLAVFSLSRLWKHPRLLPIAVVTLIAFLSDSIVFSRYEGGTIPMVFYTGIAALLIVAALYAENKAAPAVLVLVFAGCSSAKFEGMLFAAGCCCALLPFAIRRGWWKNSALHKGAIAAAICLVPYLIYRRARPAPNAESAWLHTGAAMPAAVLHRFPQVWFMDIFDRFFNGRFFRWAPQNDHLAWSGQWIGWKGFLNIQLGALPWLLLVLLLLTIIYKRRARTALGVLWMVVFGVFTFISFVIACLHANDLESVIDFCYNVVGRYFYPFFVALFLGTAAVWFMDGPPRPAETVPAPVPLDAPSGPALKGIEP